ncbi:MAG: tail fiber domain-containing protein [Alteromonadaceae bacterium]|nr:tail fiber domain-containing protein [Alteromonadaceae bacterium]
MQAALSSFSVAPEDDSNVKRTNDGRVKVKNATESDDAVALGQMGDGYNRNLGTSSGDIAEYTDRGISSRGYGGLVGFATSDVYSHRDCRYIAFGGAAANNPFGTACIGLTVGADNNDSSYRSVQMLMGYSGANTGRLIVMGGQNDLWNSIEMLNDTYDQVINGYKEFRNDIVVDSGTGSYREISLKRGDHYARIRCGTSDARTGFYNGRASIEWVYSAQSGVPGITTDSNVGINGDITADSFIETSDQRLKANEYEVQNNKEILNVWGSLRAKFFQWNRAIEMKGEEHARFHAGWMAQEIEQALVDSGLGIDPYGLICKQPVYEEQETGEVEEYQVKVTETVTEDQTEIQVIDGTPTQIVTSKEKQVECCDMVQVVDEAGNGLTEKIRTPVVDENNEPVLDPAGKPTYEMREVPVTHPVPRMETKTRPVTQQVIVDYKYRLRYTQCLILETAYLRRELESIKDAAQ